MSATATRSRRPRTIRTPGAELCVAEHGDPTATTLVLAHGYPDTQAMWDELVAALRDRFHVVTFDLRGMGRSRFTGEDRSMRVDVLAADLDAVADAVCPDAPVHLVGHDWGAFACWAALTSPHARERFDSFTAVAGPRLDRTRAWLLRRLRAGAIGDVAGQALKSYYIGAFQLPALPELALRGMRRSWPLALRRVEGVEPRPGHPAETIVADATAGLALYRDNMNPLRGGPRDGGAVPVPVQLLVPTADVHISPRLYDDAAEWAERVWRRDVRAGHWVTRSHPAVIARAIGELVEHAGGAPEPPALARARLSGPRRGFAGRLAVVTGAGSGIGRATALALAREGAEVIAADIDLASATATAEHEERIHAARVDVADADAMERFAADVERAYGVPSIVVNNAGIGIAGPFLETGREQWERIVGVNQWGVIHGARLFARQMVAAAQAGQIVNVASAAAYTPSRTLPAYCTTKAAVLMLSECMRAELHEHGIGVTAVCPGVIDTNITRSVEVVGVDAAEQERLRRRAASLYALRRYGPEGVARAIVAAVRSNPAVVTVTPEARLMREIARFAPSVARRLARVDAPG